MVHFIFLELYFSYFEINIDYIYDVCEILFTHLLCNTQWNIYPLSPQKHNSYLKGKKSLLWRWVTLTLEHIFGLPQIPY